MDDVLLKRYLVVFGKLKRHLSPGHGSAPHKPILLLAIIDEIENGRIVDNLIELSPELILVFEDYWKTLVTDAHWQMKIEYPFRHLYQEGFWNFVVYEQEVAPDPRSYTIKQLKESFDGVRLSHDLWNLLQDKAAQNTLRHHLLQTYFQLSTAVRPDVATLMYSEAEKLKAEANSKFRAKKMRENNDAGYYVRHTLFPKVIKDLYRQKCAVCELATRTPSGSSIIDAAHILPFADFHNDDPRNGIALCKNHHWGFDIGMFSLTSTYTIITSPKLHESNNYLLPGKQILLPDNPKYAPDLDAIKWHLTKIFKK